MADVRSAENGLREPSDGHWAAPLHKLVEEREACLDLGARRAPVRRLGARMRRDDVPEQDLLLQP
jgi:hypothetical protein